MRINFDVPNNWELTKLETLAKQEKGSIRIGPFGSALKKHEYSDSGIGVLGIEHVHPNQFKWETPKYIPEKKYRELTQYTVSPGDVLVTNMGTVGRTCYVPDNIEKSIISSHLIKISLDKNRCLPKYLCYALNNFELVKAQIVAKCHGAIMAGFNSTLLKELKIPLPPLDQQKKIAAILDAADAFRQKTKALISKYDELTQSLFLEMFGDPVTNPKGWSKEKLDKHIELVNGRAYKREELLNQGTPVLRIQNLNGGDRWFYSDLELPEKKYCYEEDLLFAWSASFGPFIYKGVKAIFHYHIWNCHLKSTITKSYAYYLLLRLTESIKSASHGASMLHITKGKMEDWGIIVPPFDLQNKFAERVQAIEAQKAQAQASLEKAEDLFNSLLQRAFKGELV